MITNAAAKYLWDVQQAAERIGFRNVLVHAYRDVDSKEVWSTVQDDLPGLLSAVADLLRKAPGP